MFMIIKGCDTDIMKGTVVAVVSYVVIPAS